MFFSFAFSVLEMDVYGCMHMFEDRCTRKIAAGSFSLWYSGILSGLLRFLLQAFFQKSFFDVCWYGKTSQQVEKVLLDIQVKMYRSAFLE